MAFDIASGAIAMTPSATGDNQYDNSTFAKAETIKPLFDHPNDMDMKTKLRKAIFWGIKCSICIIALAYSVYSYNTWNSHTTDYDTIIGSMSACMLLVLGFD